MFFGKKKPPLLQRGESGSNSPITVRAVGNGGIDSLREYVRDDTVQWAVLRVGIGEGPFRRTKLVDILINGDDTRAVSRGRLNARHGDVKMCIGDVNGSWEVTRAKELTVDNLCEELKYLFIDSNLEFSDLRLQYKKNMKKVVRKGITRKGGATPKRSKSSQKAGGATPKRSKSLQKAGLVALTANDLPGLEDPKSPLSSELDRREVLTGVGSSGGPFNWVTFRPAKLDADNKLADGQEDVPQPIQNAGNGGLDEMRWEFEEDDVMFGLLRLVFSPGKEIPQSVSQDAPVKLLQEDSRHKPRECCLSSCGNCSCDCACHPQVQSWTTWLLDKLVCCSRDKEDESTWWSPLVQPFRCTCICRSQCAQNSSCCPCTFCCCRARGPTTEEEAEILNALALFNKERSRDRLCGAVVKHIFVQWTGPSASLAARELADGQLEAAASAAREVCGGDMEVLKVSNLDNFNLEEISRELRAPSHSVTGSLNRMLSNGTGVDLSKTFSGNVDISPTAAMQGLAEEQLEEEEDEGDSDDATDVLDDADEELDVKTAIEEVKSANGMWDWVLLQCGGKPHPEVGTWSKGLLSLQEEE